MGFSILYCILGTHIVYTLNAHLCLLCGGSNKKQTRTFDQRNSGMNDLISA